jgi:hypothetical protein
MNILRLSTLSLAVAIVVLALAYANPSFAGKQCDADPTHPSCKDDGGGGDPPDPDPGSGNANPRLVYRDRDNLPASFLANENGSSQTQIRDAGIIGSLDAPRYRVLFRGDGLDLLTYENVGGEIVNVAHTVLLEETDIGETDIAFAPRGVTDWSQAGDKISYTYRESTSEGSIRRMMVAAIDESGQIPPFADHITVYETAPDGGLGFAAWDASGNFIFLALSNGICEGCTDLLVLDVREGTEGEFVDVADRIVKQINLDPYNGNGVNSIQWLSAGSQTSLYSFDRSGGYPDSDSSLCLMVANAEWGAQPNPIYSTWIIDLPAIFDTVSGQMCPYENVGSPIIGFQGSDFTTDDAGIVGRDFGKPRPQGIYVHDPDQNELKRIVKVGSRPDWSN